MQYLGGKARISSWLVEKMAPCFPTTRVYLEPFVGGANSLCAIAPHVPGWLAGDASPDVGAFWRAVISGWVPPHTMSREQYVALRAQPQSSPLKSAAGFCSFGGKWFAGYPANRRGDDFFGAFRRAVARQAKVLKSGTIETRDYTEWSVGKGFLVYCDPPYRGTTGYGAAFDHERFWDVVRDWSSRGARVVVSEYEAPGDFVIIGERTVRRSLSASHNSETCVERLFTLPALPRRLK